MTIDEAIALLKRNADGYYPKMTEALNMAIKALEERKEGHWIVEEWNNKEHHTCSVCQKVVDYEPCYHYCPYCGAKMESEEV